MKYAPLVLLLGLFTTQCIQHVKPTPDPDAPLMMQLSVDYSNPTALTVQLRGTMFKTMAGPQEVPFDKAEVYLAEGSPSNLSLLTTSTQKDVTLPALKPNTVYYVSTKGYVGAKVSQLSGSVPVIPDVLTPTGKLMPYDRMSFYSVSPDGNRAIRQYRNASGRYVTMLTDGANTRELSPYTATDNGIFYCQGWDGAGQVAFFEINRSKKRQFVSYDVTRQVYTELSIPAEADIWNYALSPDGQQLVFTDYKRSGLWYFSNATKTQKSISGFQIIYALNWTPDSQHILVTGPNPTGSGVPRVVQLNPQTNAQTDVLSEAASVSKAKMSPDGRFLLFESNLSGAGNIWLQNRETRQLRVISNGSQFGWLANGSFWADYRQPDSKPTGEREANLWVFKP